MNFYGLSYIIFGVIYFIFSFIFREKVSIYNRNKVSSYEVRKYNRYNKSKKSTIIKTREFLSLQFNFAIINSIYLIAFGVLVMIYSLDGIIFVSGIIPFHLINYLFLLVCKSRNYIKANNYK